MGKKIRNQANNLGLTKLRKTSLYARAKNIRMMAFSNAPDTADAIKDYLKPLDPSFVNDKSGGGRNATYYYLAPQLELYVEVISKVSGFSPHNPANHAIQINIFCEKDEYIRAIANLINQIWEDGILPHINWEKIKKKYKVNKQDAIATWNEFL